MASNKKLSAAILQAPESSLCNPVHFPTSQFSAFFHAQGCTTFNLPPNVATKLFQVQGTLDTAGEFDAAARRNGGTEQE